jgi:hypothetical protein
MKFDIVEFLIKCNTFQFLLKSYIYNGHSTWQPACVAVQQVYLEHVCAKSNEVMKLVIEVKKIIFNIFYKMFLFGVF